MYWWSRNNAFGLEVSQVPVEKGGNTYQRGNRLWLKSSTLHQANAFRSPSSPSLPSPSTEVTLTFHSYYSCFTITWGKQCLFLFWLCNGGRASWHTYQKKKTLHANTFQMKSNITSRNFWVFNSLMLLCLHQLVCKFVCLLLWCV